ncbi:MAG: carboxypeptidase-like regulatory domain-containing protein, partial [Bacteroidota bacterium]
MRHLFLLCTLLLATCFLWGHEGEELIIKERYEQKALEEIFKDLHKKYQVFFSYRKKQISDIKISVDIPESSLPIAMQLILADTDLDFEILDERFVLIKPREIREEPIPYICGWVLDSLSEKAIPFANLSIPSQGKGAVSQTDGSFYIKGKIPFEAEVIITYIGYEKKQLSFGELRKGPCAPILLKQKTLTLQGLEISEYLTDGISRDPLSIKLSPEKVSALPGLTEPDIFQMAQVLPGVNSPDETAAGLHIRGGTPDQTLVMIEGMPLYQTGHFFDMISSINPYAIDEARVSRSGFDVSRAGRVSGAIDLSQGNEIPDKLGLGLSFNLTHMGFDLKAPLLKKKMAILFSSRRSTTDFFPTLTFSRLQDRVFQGTRIGWLRELEDQTDYFSVDYERFAFNDWNFKLLYHIKDKHQLSFSSFNGKNQLNYHVSIEEEDEFLKDDLEILNAGFAINWEYKDSLKYISNTRLSFSEYNSRYSYLKQNFEQSFDFEEFGKRNNVKDNRLTSDHQ